MACRGLRFSLFRFFVVFFWISVVSLFSSEFQVGGFGQEPERRTGSSSSPEGEGGREEASPVATGGLRLKRDWNQRGRTVPGGKSAARLRFRAYQQKMALRAQRAATAPTPPLLSSSPQPRIAKNAKSGAPASVAGPTRWEPLGPAPLASDATGDGGQDYNWVSGRATSVVIDPSDTSGNTVFLGGAYGGLWKSTNAGSLSSDPASVASVTWQALIDDQPTLAVGAIALQPGNSDIILVGTGETNNSADSYYGLGILRSADGGLTWKEITGIGATPDNSFLGIGFSKIAFSTVNPEVVVAATAGDNGLCLGLEGSTGDSGPCLGPEEDGKSTARGLYFSTNAGSTWNHVTLADGAVPASATAVIYNASQGPNGTFYAFVRRHELYSSSDGENFARLATEPGAGLASGLCPASSNATTCLIYRGEFAVVPGRNEMYVWVVDVQPDSNGNPVAADEGIWQTLNGGTNWTLIADNGITNCGDSAFGLNSGCGVEQGWYNLALAAIPNPPPPSSAGTDIYAGAINLYKCTLEPAGSSTCTQGDWINLTHAYGCSPLAAPAHMHPEQHEIAFTVASGKTPGYFAHDGGISRTLDGYSGLTTGSCTGTNQFDSLSETLGSMTEFVSVSVHPTSADILLGGTQNNGSPKTSNATENSTWHNALSGDGGFAVINPANANEWFASNPYVTILECESATGTGTECNDSTFLQIVGSSDLGGDQGAYDTPYILDPQNTGEMLVGTCRVWQITTRGTSPLQLSNDFDTLGTGVCTGDEINLVDALAAGGPVLNGSSSVVYAVTNGYGPLSGSPGGEVWVSTNAGVTLMNNVTQNVNPNGYAISSVAMDASDATGKTAYVGIMGFSTQLFPTSHVWQTTNAGVSWTDWAGTLPTELPDAPVNALLVDSSVTPSRIYAGTDVGVFVSSTSAPSWKEAGPTPAAGVSGFLPNAPVTALQIFDHEGTKTLVASTYGRGVWNYALAPDYTNAISNSPQTVFPAQNAVFNGTLAAVAGYASPVNLSCTGATPATCSLNPPQIAFSGLPTAAYTVTAGGAVGDYSFNAHAVGTDENAITHDATVTLHVVDFNLTAPSPNSMSVGQGGTSATSTFQVTAAGSFVEAVLLSCPTGLPTGAACVFLPSSSVMPTSSAPVTVTLSVTAGAGTAVGGPTTVTIAAMATGAPAAKTQTFGLTVTAPVPDFTIAVTATQNTTVANQNVAWNGTLTAINGYSGNVTLTCTAGAPGTCITPAPVTPTAGGTLFTVTLGSATAGAFNFTIQGTDGTLTHPTPTETLTVGTDVTWTDTGNSTVTVLAGQSASYTFSAAPAGGASFSSAVSFACSGLPPLITGGPGASCEFSPASIAAGTTGATPVTVTISTTGPNLGTESRQGVGTVLRMAWTAGGGRPYASIRLDALRFFTLAWVLLAGMVGVGLKRRDKARLYGGIAGICLVLGLLAEISCGGVAGGGSTTPPPVTVTVNPGLATLFANELNNSWPAGATQQQFTATVNGSTNQSVTWAIIGGGTNGAVDATTGLYSAPVFVPSQATVTVTATSAAATAPGSTFVTVAAPTVVGASQVTVTAAAVGGAAHGDVVTLTVQ
jgi:hypothetical protein